MIWIDYVIIIIICFSTLIGLIRGFIIELLSFITLGSAFFITSKFYNNISNYITNINNILIRNSIAIILLFIVILVIRSVINYIISFLIKKTGLFNTDYILGICFGIFRGILIVSIILFFIDTFTNLSKSQDWKHSKLIPQFSYIIKWFFNYLKNKSNFY
ncbi:MAG: colicin V production protein [Arsenophonus endosymbiont of Ceratovacuna japonica]